VVKQLRISGMSDNCSRLQK